jgi:hydroxyethylthiazole kinase-like uncharacterized protein yjeF
MKILNGKQLNEADRITIEKEQITSDVLMERAAMQLFNWIHQRMQGAPVKLHIFCGIGNNGGDGLALARHLKEHGYDVAIYVVNYSEKRSPDFLLNLDRVKDRKVWPQFITKESVLPNIDPEDIIVDGIFGTGLNRSPEDWVASLIQHLNTAGAFILSIDIPSGLFVDSIFDNDDGIIKANYTITFQHPKLAFFLPQTGVYTLQWEALDIGLDAEHLEGIEVAYEFVQKEDVIPWYLPRKKFSHKGSYGHTLVIGGSYGKVGAVLLTSKASLKAGSGLVTAFLPKCGYTPLQGSLPEAMVITDTDDREITHIAFDINPTVVAFGVGCGTSDRTMDAFASFLKGNTAPLVIDADGLNLLSIQKSLLELLPPKCILTPHPKELERLIGDWKDDFDKLEKAKKFAGTYDCVLVVKGAHTITFYDGKGFINSTGNPGMATAGSGDVLTGIIAGLLAQGYEPLVAAVFGVYLHGKAGDLGVTNTGIESLMASDIIDHIGMAFSDLFQMPGATETTEETGEE